jgi:hypothetical protein
MLRIHQAGNALPYSFACDPNAEFQPGQLAQLTLFGNNVVCGVSDGSAPIGIIDDVKTNAFSSVSIDEEVIAPVPSVVDGNGDLVSAIDIKIELNNPNVLASSFVSSPVSVLLTARNGVITYVAGTPLNFSSTGTSTLDSIRTVVSYSYQIPNVPGDDTTIASGRVTVWFMRMMAMTDMFETNQRYPLNAPLFSSDSGLLTTRQIDPDYPAIAMVTAPPTTVHKSLEFMLL